MNQAPLNYLQRYVFKQLATCRETAMFNLTKMYRLRKGIDILRLSKALETAAGCHQSLKTVFHRFPDGEIVQMLALDPDDLSCDIVRVSEQKLLAFRSSYVKHFDLFDQGLLDAMIFDCGKNAYLLSNFHHLVADGYSFPVILHDARRVWNGEAVEEDNYYAVLARRAARAQLPVSVAARNLMNEILRNGEFATLPGNDLNADSRYGVSVTSLELPGDFEEKLASLKVTKHHFFLAATALALSKITGSDNVEVDWVFHGRLSKDEARTCGPFMVDLPFPLTDIASKSASEVLYETKRQTFFGIKNAHAITNTDNDPLGGRRMTFIYQAEWGDLMSEGPVDPEGPFGWAIEETVPLRPPQIEAENPFNVNIMEKRSGTRLVLEYDAGRYLPSTVARFAEHFKESAAWLYG